MVLYDIKSATTLTVPELDRLRVRGVGLEVNAKLAECGVEPTGVPAAIIMAIEKSKIKGCKWALTGGFDPVTVPTQRLGGERGKQVVLDLSDLTRFSFPGDQDPRNGVNRSEWMPASQLVSKIIKRDKEEITDKKEIEEDELMAKGGFSVRLTILPVGVGQVAVWMGAAPGDAAHIKAEAEKRGLDEYSATIPTLGVPLGPKQKSSQASARMCPAEGDLVSKKWGMYPLLLKLDEEAYPSCRSIWREFCRQSRSGLRRWAVCRMNTCCTRP